MTDDDKTIQTPEMKHFSYIGKTDSIDLEERTLIAKITTDSRDRDDEVLLPKGVKLENYNKNKIVLWSHDSGGFGGSPGETIIAKAIWIKGQKDGLVAKIKFAMHEAADRIFKLYVGGFLNAWSVGFIPGASHEPTEKELKKRPDWAGVRRIYDEWELLEFSAVSIPANADALTMALSKGLTLPEGLKVEEADEEAVDVELERVTLKATKQDGTVTWMECNVADGTSGAATAALAKNQEDIEALKAARRDLDDSPDTITFPTREEADKFMASIEKAVDIGKALARNTDDLAKSQRNLDKLEQASIDAAERREKKEPEPEPERIQLTEPEKPEPKPVYDPRITSEWDGKDMEDCHIGIGVDLEDIDKGTLHMQTWMPSGKDVHMIAGINPETNSQSIHKIFYPYDMWTIAEAKDHAKALGAREIILRQPKVVILPELEAPPKVGPKIEALPELEITPRTKPKIETLPELEVVPKPPIRAEILEQLPPRKQEPTRVEIAGKLKPKPVPQVTILDKLKPEVPKVQIVCTGADVREEALARARGRVTL